MSNMKWRLIDAKGRGYWAPEGHGYVGDNINSAGTWSTEELLEYWGTLDRFLSAVSFGLQIEAKV